jgi:hypothetical protein
VLECEKGAKMSELWKKEKKLREERENQIVEMGEEHQMLRNQIQYMQDEMSGKREREANDVQESELIKSTVLEQQLIIDKMRVDH